MRLAPRSYQTEAVDSLYKYFETHPQGNPLIAMPTGTGKSVVIAMFLESIYERYKGQRVLVLTHVKELIDQNYKKLLNLWPNAPAGVNSAGLKKSDFDHAIVFAGIATVAKKASRFGRIDLIVVDEAHMVSMNEKTMYRKFINELMKINPYLRVIGLTATPWRLGHGSIAEGGIFTDICFDITGIQAFNRLIAEGFLCPVVPVNTTMLLDTNGVHIKGGEYIESELQKAVNKEDLTEAAIREALEKGHDRKHWLIFCAGVDHAKNTARILSTIGFPCGVVHSEMTGAERDQVLEDFKSGKIRAIANNNVLTTGFDFPAIDLILMLRPTMSAVLWVQMLGRGTRPFEGKENCLVLDFSGNSKKLGPINDPLLPRKKGDKRGTAPIKECENCHAWNHASLRYCGGQPMKTAQGCGEEFLIKGAQLNATASTSSLIKGDLPVVEIFKVDHITYSEHIKHDVPPSMKVSYYCGLKMFNDWVCFEHGENAGKKAGRWWRERSEEKVPIFVKDALDRAESLRPATHVRVWINKKYPEILGVCLDGTAFGTMDPTFELPTVKSNKIKDKGAEVIDMITRKPVVSDGTGGFTFEDDDIPF